jgi:hypothetical protein
VAAHILLQTRLPELEVNALLLQLVAEIGDLLLEGLDAVVFGGLIAIV